MSDELTCAAARELAPDLALGLLPGAERARLLAHLAGCASCDALVAELADVADSLLLLAPGADPPPGFESAVLARIDREPAPVTPESAGPESGLPGSGLPGSVAPGSGLRGSVAPGSGLPGSVAPGSGLPGSGGPGPDSADGPVPASPSGRPRRPVRVALLALAAAVLLVGGTAAGVELAHRGPEYPQVRSINGRSLRTAALVGPKDQAWGSVYLFNGKTSDSWVMVTMRWDVPDGTYNVVVDRRTGSPEWLTRLHLAGGEGSIGTTLVDASDVTAVRVLDAEGHPVCEARFA
jgi:anti-sigma factor RsiW